MAEFWSRRNVAIAGGVVAALVVGAVAWVAFLGGRGGCSSRDDVAARVALVSSGLQQAAAQGLIKIEQLAEGVKRLNAASTAYETSQDHQAYCDALDQLRTDYKIGESE